ncbi:MAG: hypothetical protein RJA09_1508 [Pseudomonadota bacterium]
MRLSGWFLKKLAWVALCAVAFGALAPTTARWLSSSRNTTWVEVCTAQGTKLLAVEANGGQRPSIPTLAENPCGYCLLQQQSPCVPTQMGTWGKVPNNDLRTSGMAGHKVTLARPRGGAHQPRAPPVFS